VFMHFKHPNSCCVFISSHLHLRLDKTVDIFGKWQVKPSSRIISENFLAYLTQVVYLQLLLCLLFLIYAIQRQWEYYYWKSGILSFKISDICGILMWLEVCSGFSTCEFFPYLSTFPQISLLGLCGCHLTSIRPFALQLVWEAHVRYELWMLLNKW
jgi:hypothetical protein